MPGPCSAPNGDRSLINLNADERRKRGTGKTARKHSGPRHATPTKPAPRKGK